MRLSISGSVPKLDKAAIRKAVGLAVQTVFRKAAQQFLLTAIPRVPIWTGMARGAFRNLEDEVGKVTADAQSGGVRIRGTRGGGNQTGKYRRGYYYTPPGGGRIERTPQSGRQFATPQDKIFNFKGATLASGRTAYYFRFEIDITYFDVLDQLKWGAFKAAGDAFVDYVNAHLELPDIGKFLLTRRS